MAGENCGMLIFSAVDHALKSDLTRLSQLVIEPLRALIHSQMREMEQRGIASEWLLPQDEAKRSGKLGSWHRLEQLTMEKKCKPLVLFATPELLLKTKQPGKHLKKLVEMNHLVLVVVDEFDFVNETNEIYRPEVVPCLINHACVLSQLFC